MYDTWYWSHVQGMHLCTVWTLQPFPLSFYLCLDLFTRRGQHIALNHILKHNHNFKNNMYKYYYWHWSLCKVLSKSTRLTKRYVRDRRTINSKWFFLLIWQIRKDHIVLEKSIHWTSCHGWDEGLLSSLAHSHYFYLEPF